MASKFQKRDLGIYQAYSMIDQTMERMVMMRQWKVLEWIADSLSDRKMRIVVRSEYSEWFDVISGVPKGSILGPILFSLCK